jgi:hypothetical protein
MQQSLQKIVLVFGLSLLLVANFNANALHAHTDDLERDCVACAHTADADALICEPSVDQTVTYLNGFDSYQTRGSEVVSRHHPPARAPPAE